MNGFSEHGLDEGAFGEKSGNIVQAFDAFRECSSILCHGCYRMRWAQCLYSPGIYILIVLLRNPS
jgi:hypothetical protein